MPASHTETVLRLPAVKAVTGRGRSSIYADPTFPKPIKLGPRAVGWLKSEIDAWLESRIAARDGVRA